MSDTDDQPLPRRRKTVAPLGPRAHDPSKMELGHLRLALEDMGDVLPRLVRLVVRSFASGQVNMNDLIECRHFIAKIHCHVNFKKFDATVDPKHINNSATNIRE